MSRVIDPYTTPPELVLGARLNARVPSADQERQAKEVKEILRRLRRQPGVVLADEVGMGKTFVALAVAYSVASRSPHGPVVVMVPPNLVDKWKQDLTTFCELYLENRRPVRRAAASQADLKDPTVVRYGIARDSVGLMKLLDDSPRERCHLIFLGQGAMARRQTDKWVRLALIAEALRRHGRGGARRLIQVKGQIHRFLAELLWAIGEQRAHDLGEDLWQRLLSRPTEDWRETYNKAVREEWQLRDDPVPKSMGAAIPRIHLRSLAEALEEMPVRVKGGEDRASERIDAVRKALRSVEEELWKGLLAEARWRSPLLVVDEAHHLKNPGTHLARQLQSPDSEKDLRRGDGSMSKAFDRMLFLTATPFQLGHHELVRVLDRFGDVRWDAEELGELEAFRRQLADLGQHLDDSQRAAIALQRNWTRLRPEDREGNDDVQVWWAGVSRAARESLTPRQRAVRDAFDTSKRTRAAAEGALMPWIVRHNKGSHWNGTSIVRRERVDGAGNGESGSSTGLAIPEEQLLPFFLAARSAVRPGQDLLGEALCSSYEAFRFTRQNRDPAKDEQDEEPDQTVDLSHADWYLSEFDLALERCHGSNHPKVDATVRRVADLWEKGEKVLVFAFYRHTCRALRVHISQEIDRRTMLAGQKRLHEAGRTADRRHVEGLIETVQRRYFDDADSPGRRAVDSALAEVLHGRDAALEKAGIDAGKRDDILDVMRRYLRAQTTLVRCFPFAQVDSLDPIEAVQATLDHADGSGFSWRHKFDKFVQFLAEHCSTAEERQAYLDAALQTKTGRIRVDLDEDEAPGGGSKATLPNVQVATGKTKREARSRLMQAFNTPFFPDVLVCSEVMGEGVDLQRFCRHVVHHDLAWNPSTIEQRTGRIDRLGCKAESRQPILVYLPYLAGTADERQYRVMLEREQWFRVVMGQDEVGKLITPDASTAIPLPASVADELSFRLGLEGVSR